jgi:hypothetical protein
MLKKLIKKVLGWIIYILYYLHTAMNPTFFLTEEQKQALKFVLSLPEEQRKLISKTLALPEEQQKFLLVALQGNVPTPVKKNDEELDNLRKLCEKHLHLGTSKKSFKTHCEKYGLKIVVLQTLSVVIKIGEERRITLVPVAFVYEDFQQRFPNAIVNFDGHLGTTSDLYARQTELMSQVTEEMDEHFSEIYDEGFRYSEEYIKVMINARKEIFG